MVVQVAVRVYMFHSCKFRAPMMSPFFCPYQPFDDITLDDICPYFPLPRYPTNGESKFNTRLTPTVSLDSDPSKPSYPSYNMESNPSEPSCPSMILLTSNSSSSSIAPRHVPPGSWSWVHPHPCCTLWAWALLRRRMW